MKFNSTIKVFLILTILLTSIVTGMFIGSFVSFNPELREKLMITGIILVLPLLVSIIALIKSFLNSKKNNE